MWRSILPYRLTSDTAGASLEDVERRVVQQQGRRLRAFQLSCTVMMRNVASSPAQPGVPGQLLAAAPVLELFHYRSHSERDAEAAMQGETGDLFVLCAGESILPMEGPVESLHDSILAGHSKKAMVVFKGHKYAVGDFEVSVGTLTSNSAAIGLLVEVELPACCAPGGARGLLSEFVKRLKPFCYLPAQLIVPPGYAQAPGQMPSSMDASSVNLASLSNPKAEEFPPSLSREVYSPSHAAFQYLKLYRGLGVLSSERPT